MKPRVCVLQFPGVNCESETERALESAGLAAERVPWATAPAAISSFDGYVLPGGFSYQDRVRAGAIAARHRFMDVLRERAERGAPMLGICNGAQVLVEAGLVPGVGAAGLGAALSPNRMPGRAGYLARWVTLRVEETPCLFTQAFAPGEIVPLPMAHGEGRFAVHPPEGWSELERTRRVPFRYDAGVARAGGSSEEWKPRVVFPANPNGSFGDAAAVSNARGNVLALMPHPERAQSLAHVPLDLPGPWGERRRRARVEGASVWGAGPGAGVFLSMAYALGVREAVSAKGENGVTQVRQLVVRHRALDPTAWTALTALRAAPGPQAPAALARADLWEFEWEGAAAVEEALAVWAREANGFANPNRDRATWRRQAADATDLEAGAALASGESGAQGPGAFLVTTWRDAVRSSEHEAAASRALGVSMRVRRAQVWWLSAESGDPSAALAAAGGGASGGLLANPHSQAASLYGGTLPVPAIVENGGAR